MLVLPLIIILTTLTAGAALLYFRTKRSLLVTEHGTLGLSQDVQRAAQRFGYDRSAEQHPVCGIEDKTLAIAGIVAAFQSLDGAPTQDQHRQARKELQSAWGLDDQDGHELYLLGHWLAKECGCFEQAVSRLTRKLGTLTEGTGCDTLAQIINGIVAFGGGALSEKQVDAIEEIKSHFPDLRLLTNVIGR